MSAPGIAWVPPVGTMTACSSLSGSRWAAGLGMTDVILIATILVFFLAAALLVGAVGGVVAASGDDAGPEDGAAEQGIEPGRPA